jgi:DNA polymerase-1
MDASNTVFLIDGSSQMYRAFHAIRGLSAPDGRPTNAVFGFVTMLRKLIADHRPALIAAAFDVRGPTFRNELAADYKANRAPMPPDLREQVPHVHEACEALGVPVLTHATFEADDVIGTLAAQARVAGFDVAIVTGDKDFFQLVRDGVSVFNPRDPGTWYDAGGVQVKFGVGPEQVIDVLALMGDAVDNVKGVPGIGEKGARELIAAHGSLDALLEHTADVKKKRQRTALEQHADEARRSRVLVTIRTDVPVPFEPDTLRYRGPATDHCFTLFTSLGFRTLVPEYAPTATTVKKDYAVVRSESELAALLDAIGLAGRVGLAVVAGESDAMRADLVGIALSAGPRHARYVPLGHRTLGADAGLGREALLAALAKPLADAAVAKVGHDLKQAALVLGRHGVPLAGLDLDTLLASYLLDATRSGHDLGDLALEAIGYKAITPEEVFGKGAKALSPADVPVDAVVEYAGERSDLALQVAEGQRAQLARDGLEPLYRDLELPLVPVLADLERAGVRLDVDALAVQSVAMDKQLSALQAEIHALAGEPFNINSPRQLSTILFDKLQLPSRKRTGKTKAASTSVDVLEELALVHELPRRVLEWRSLAKLKGTYVDALPQLVNPETGRLHTSFNQAVATTGRLSSRDPNLQNIPIRTAVGREIRGAFTAPPGAVLISADYSQIELRVLAHLSGDANLTGAFERGEDIHDRTAFKVFGAESGLDPHELRRRAKIVNYALLYGKTAFTLSKDIGVTPKAAQTFIDAYFEGFPAVRAYLEKTLDTARETGVVTTMFERRRRVPEIVSRNGQLRSAAERVAVNMPIQGSAADILKRAMIDVHAALPPDARMILTVHDELLFEAPESDARDVAELVRTKMESAVELSVPLTVDVGIGRNWKEAKG